MAVRGKQSQNLPAVPSGLDAQTKAFLGAVKETLEVMQGKRRNTALKSVVTFEDLSRLGLKVSQKGVGTDAEYDFSRNERGDNVPNPPRDLKVERQIFANKLSWTNPSTSKKALSHVEVWCAAGSQSLSDAQRIGIVTYPNSTFTHAGLNTRVSHCYWIRIFNWQGQYSPWEPVQGGFVVLPSVDVEVAEALHVLEGSITESELYDSLNTRLNHIESNKSQIAVNTSDIQNVKAECFVKTDVNGYIAGFGIANDGATSEAIFLVDKFAVITPGGVKRAPFIIGSVGGVSTVGINGDLLVDGSVATKHLDSEIITGAFLSASAQIQLGTGGLLRMMEGAKLYAGDGNFLLDTSGTTKLLMGEDGAIDSLGGVAVGKNYTKYTGADIEFYRWMEGGHRLFKSLKRMTTGFAENGTTVLLDGFWEAAPQVHLSPRNLKTFDKNSPSVDQALNMEVTTVELQPGHTNKYQFSANARLVIAAGTSDFPVGLTDSTSLDTGTAQTVAYRTPAYCSGATISFKVKAIKPTDTVNTFQRRSVVLRVYVNGSQKAARSVDVGETIEYITGTISVSGLSSYSSGHDIYMTATAYDESGTFMVGDMVYDYTTTSSSKSYTDPEAHAGCAANGYPDGESDSDSDTFPVPYSSAGSGWEAYKVRYSANYTKRTSDGSNASASAGCNLFSTSDGDGNSTVEERSSPVTSARVSASASAWCSGVGLDTWCGSASAMIQIHSITAQIYWRKPQGSTDSTFTEVVFDSASVYLTGANTLAEGTVNYVAMENN